MYEVILEINLNEINDATSGDICSRSSLPYFKISLFLFLSQSHSCLWVTKFSYAHHSLIWTCSLANLLLCLRLYSSPSLHLKPTLLDFPMCLQCEIVSYWECLLSLLMDVHALYAILNCQIQPGRNASGATKREPPNAEKEKYIDWARNRELKIEKVRDRKEKRKST